MKTQTRWKPKVGEEIYTVTDDGYTMKYVWCSNFFYKRFLTIGNCYRTRKEAQAAAKRVKAAYKW